MRLLTYLELSRYSHAELDALLREMYAALRRLDPRSRSHATAVMNIRHLRIFLARRSYRLKIGL